MTKKQQEICKSMTGGTGFNNGHVYYMVTRLSNDQIGTLLEYLDNKEKEDMYCFCYLNIEKSKKGNTVSFHSHEKCLGEIQDEISAIFPDAVVYWNDCWDYEGTMVVSQNGAEIEPQNVCRVTLDYDNTTDDEDYFETIAIVTDDVTGANFEIGGGYIFTDERKSIYDLIRATQKKVA